MFIFKFSFFQICKYIYLYLVFYSFWFKKNEFVIQHLCNYVLLSLLWFSRRRRHLHHHCVQGICLGLRGRDSRRSEGFGCCSGHFISASNIKSPFLTSSVLNKKSSINDNTKCPFYSFFSLQWFPSNIIGTRPRIMSFENLWNLCLGCTINNIWCCSDIG